MKKIFFATIITCIIYSCAYYPNLKSGDIIFCSYNSGALSSAIDAVTGENMNTSYSHMALVTRKGNSIRVIHAKPGKGVINESLDSFINNEQAEKMSVFRLKDEYNDIISCAIDSAKNLEGLPYNNSFVMNDSSFYCSQMIYAVFSKHEPFELQPMTFKDSSGEFNKEWVDYFEALKIDIPEGSYGCNPNGMSKSTELYFVEDLIY